MIVQCVIDNDQLVIFDATQVSQVGVLQEIKRKDGSELEVIYRSGGSTIYMPLYADYLYQSRYGEPDDKTVWELRLRDERVPRYVIGGIRF